MDLSWILEKLGKRTRGVVVVELSLMIVIMVINGGWDYHTGFL